MIQHFFDDVEGFFTGADAKYYELVINHFIYGKGYINTPTLHMVEVGSWKGRSSSIIAVEIANSGRNVRFDCVDTWKGSPELTDDVDVINDTVFDRFIDNMKPVTGFFRALRMNSIDAASTYPDQSLDYVFIDAAHDYDSVRNDISAWIPKIKPNGMIGGHDFFHPPVVQAVHEILPDAVGIYGCWHQQVTPNMAEQIKNKRTKL
jgi:hypothetical protein